MTERLGAKDILIKNANIIDPYKQKEYVSDVLIEQGFIKKVSPGLSNAEGGLKIDAGELILAPGLVDMHVHLRDPGDEKKEDIESGIRSALAGGFVAVACMPNTRPPIDSPYLVKYIIGRSIENDFKVLPVAAMTKGIAGEQITEMGLLKESGAAAFSDDGKGIADSRLMYEIMRYSKQFNSVLILHEEDCSFSDGGLVHEGYWSNKLGLESISPLSDELMIARDILLSKQTGARIHITHVSSKNSVELIRQAKSEGVKITCDVTPHHLYFNDSWLKSFDTSLKVKPPIRSEQDQEALIQGIEDGTIDAVASDHAPHTSEEKNTTYQEAAFGAIGLETAFRGAYSKLCAERGLSLKKLLSLMTAGPSIILGIEDMPIEEGSKANLVLLNKNFKGIVKDNFFSKSKNCPFIGQELCGKVAYTISNGKLSYEEE